MQTTKITSPSSITLIVSLLVTMGLHTYLAQHHLQTKYSAEPTAAVCNISSQINCDTAIASSYSEVLGIPVAIFGLIMAVITFIYLLKYLFFSKNPDSDGSVLVALSTVTVITSLVMGSISFLVIKNICPFCFGAYIASFVTLFATYQLTSAKESFSLSHWKPILGSLFAVAVLGFATGKVVLSKYTSSDMAELYDLTVEAWEKSQAYPELQPIKPIQMGPENAKMKIVEFADFLCHHCMAAASKVSSFLKSHPDVQFNFQAFSLDACTKDSNGHPGKNCEIAMFSACAAQQGHGFETNEMIFQYQPMLYNDPTFNWDKKELSPILAEISKVMKLDTQKIVSCLMDPKTYDLIVQQKELGKKLGIEGTPTFYVNGKLLRGAANLSILQQVHRKIESQKSM